MMAKFGIKVQAKISDLWIFDGKSSYEISYPTRSHFLAQVRVQNAAQRMQTSTLRFISRASSWVEEGQKQAPDQGSHLHAAGAATPATSEEQSFLGLPRTSLLPLLLHYLSPKPSRTAPGGTHAEEALLLCLVAVLKRESAGQEAAHVVCTSWVPPLPLSKWPP